MKEVKKVIQDSIVLSRNYLNNFYASLGIDPNEIKDIYRPIRIKIFDTPELARYESDNDEILLNSIMIDYIKKSKNKDIIIKKIASIITHETIHSSRTMINKKGTIDSEYLKQKQLSYWLNEEFIDDLPNRRAVACDTIHFDTANNVDKNKIDYYTFIINGQWALEECVTEALSEIVINYYYNHNLSFEQLVDLIIQNQNVTMDALVGAKIIKAMGEDVIPWFLLTRFNSNYHDLFYEKFKNIYKPLLINIDKIYSKIFKENYTIEDHKIDLIILKRIDELLSFSHEKRL